MRDDNRSNSRGKSFGGRSNFGGGRSTFGGRDAGRPVSMHKAVCDECGNSCEVPFKPSGDKPVYCNNCFGKKDRTDSYDRKPSNRSFNDRSFNDRNDRGDREMFNAVCDECGKTCEVPFKPSNSKPIYCSDCFEKRGNGARDTTTNNGNMQDELREINSKLDAILKALEEE